MFRQIVHPATNFGGVIMRMENRDFVSICAQLLLVFALFAMLSGGLSAACRDAEQLQDQFRLLPQMVRTNTMHGCASSYIVSNGNEEVRFLFGSSNELYSALVRADGVCRWFGYQNGNVAISHEIDIDGHIVTRRMFASSLPSQIESVGRTFVIRGKEGESVSNYVGRSGWPTAGVPELQKTRERDFGNLIAGYLSDEDSVAYKKLRNLGESLLRLGVKGDYYVLTTREHYSAENRNGKWLRSTKSLLVGYRTECEYVAEFVNENGVLKSVLMTSAGSPVGIVSVNTIRFEYEGVFDDFAVVLSKCTLVDRVTGRSMVVDFLCDEKPVRRY